MCDSAVNFDIIGGIVHAETIARGTGIRELSRLQRTHGIGNRRKRKEGARIRLENGAVRWLNRAGTKHTKSDDASSSENATWPDNEQTNASRRLRRLRRQRALPGFPGTSQDLPDEEARLIPGDAVGGEPDTRDLASVIRSYFGPTSGVDLGLPPRGTSREPPSFD